MFRFHTMLSSFRKVLLNLEKSRNHHC
jgi:hypothetical protein